jgi:hypothetical protein
MSHFTAAAVSQAECEHQAQQNAAMHHGRGVDSKTSSLSLSDKSNVTNDSNLKFRKLYSLLWSY